MENLPLELATIAQIADELIARPNEPFIILWKAPDKDWLYQISPCVSGLEAMAAMVDLQKHLIAFFRTQEHK